MANQNTELLIKIRADLGQLLGDLSRTASGINGVGDAAQRATGSIHPMMLALSSPSTQAAETLAATARAAAAARAEIERTASAELGLANASRGMATEQIKLGSALTSVFSGAPESAGATSAAIAGLKSQLVGLVAVYKLLEGVKTVVGDAADLQDTETRLRALTGTSEKYAETEQYLVDLAEKKHKVYSTLADSDTRLLAVQQAGLITNREARQILEGMADATAALGVGNADLALSMRGVIQQLGNSTVQWDEMRQATDPIPGLLQGILKASGLTSMEMKAMSETGAYTTAMFRDHLIKALEAYKGASERTGQNIHAQYTDIGNAYTELVKLLEEPISDALTPLLKGLARDISQVVNGPSLQDKINELEMLKAAASPDAPRFAVNADAIGQDEIRRRRGASGTAPPDRIAVLTAEIAAIEKKNAAEKTEMELQDQQEKAARQASDAKKGLSDTEDWYSETVIADEKKVREAKEESAKKAKSAAESAAKAYQSEREAVAKNIEQLNFELSALKLSDNERAIQIKVRSLSAKATDEERTAIEAKVRALAEETTATQRQQAMWDQLIKDANASDELRKTNAEFIKRGDVQGGFNERLAATQDQLKAGTITQEQAKIEYDKLGQAYNEYFIDPAKKDTNSLSEFSVQAAHNMQSTMADFFFDPFAKSSDSMVVNFASALRRMASEAASAQLFNAILGKNFGSDNASGGLLSALFSGVTGAVGGAFGGGEAVSVANGNSAAFTDTMSSSSFWATTKHTGGLVGQASAGVYADPAIFSSATRYHSGGIPGLKPNEVPIIALNDEEVLTASDPRHRNNLKKTTSVSSNSDGIDITTNITVSAENPNDVAKGNQLGQAANASMRQLLVTEMRDGGLIDQWFRSRH